jgi:hypothetical protein
VGLLIAGRIVYWAVTTSMCVEEGFNVLSSIGLVTGYS